MQAKFMEFTAKTVEEAVEEGLKTLGLTREEAEIRVLEEGKKKLFGFVKARVEIAAKTNVEGAEEAEVEEIGAARVDTLEKEENESEGELQAFEEGTEQRAEIHRDGNGKTDGERAVEFVEGLFDILRITATAELVKEGEKIEINVTAVNTNSVIGKRGAMLDAIQTIAGAVANIGRQDYKRVVVDCENYRENREETLKNLANKLADKAMRLGKKLKLEAMNPYERRTIHAALSEKEGVTTTSEGKEPNRYVVIVPDNLTDPDAPALPARDDRNRRGGFNRDKNGFKRYNNQNGYRKPYNRDGRDGGYKKPYNNDNRDRNSFNRDNREGGYKKPYNRDRNYNRDNQNGTSNERRDYNKPKTAYKKPSMDFFGTYLGNSKDSDNE